MNDEKKPIAINACDVPGKTTSVYPEPFQNKVAGREKRALGNVFSKTISVLILPVCIQVLNHPSFTVIQSRKSLFTSWKARPHWSPKKAKDY